MYRCPLVWTQVRYKNKKSKNAGKVTAAPVEDTEIDLKKYEDSMKNTFEGLSNSYSQIRSGVPSPSLLDGKYMPVSASLVLHIPQSYIFW